MSSARGLSLFAHLRDALGALSEACLRGLSAAVPYVTADGVQGLLEVARVPSLDGTRWLVCLDPKAMAVGALEENALVELLRRGAEVRHLDGLQAKMFVARAQSAVVIGSANLTHGGLAANEEVVLSVRDEALARAALELFEDWWGRATAVTQEALSSRLWVGQLGEPKHAREAVVVLSALGAFVDIRLTSAGFKWERTIDWEEIGIPEPCAGEAVSVDKPRITALPPRLRRMVASARSRLIRGLDALERRKAAVRVGEDCFVFSESLRSVEEWIRRENERLKTACASTGPEELEQHWRIVREEVAAWARVVAERTGRSADWAAATAARITERLQAQATAPLSLAFVPVFWLPSPLQRGIVETARLVVRAHKSAGHQPRLADL